MATEKTIAKQWLEGLGWTVDDVERYLRHTNTTKDLFGFADLLAIDPTESGATLALQVTDNTNAARRVKKILAEPRARQCLECDWLVEVWGVRKQPARDGSLAVVRRIVLSAGEVAAEPGSDVIQF